MERQRSCEKLLREIICEMTGTFVFLSFFSAGLLDKHFTTELHPWLPRSLNRTQIAEIQMSLKKETWHSASYVI